jgi:hypothetical protein
MKPSLRLWCLRLSAAANKQARTNSTHHKRPAGPKNALSDQLMLQWSRMYGSANGAASESCAAVLKNFFSRSNCEKPSDEG